MASIVRSMIALVLFVVQVIDFKQKFIPVGTIAYLEALEKRVLEYEGPWTYAALATLLASLILIM